MSSFKMHENPSARTIGEHVELPEISETDVGLNLGPMSMPRASKSFKVKKMAVKGHRSGRSCTITLDAHANPEEIDLEHIKRLIGGWSTTSASSCFPLIASCNSLKLPAFTCCHVTTEDEHEYLKCVSRDA